MARRTRTDFQARTNTNLTPSAADPDGGVAGRITPTKHKELLDDLSESVKMVSGTVIANVPIAIERSDLTEASDWVVADGIADDDVIRIDIFIAGHRYGPDVFFEDAALTISLDLGETEKILGFSGEFVFSDIPEGVWVPDIPIYNTNGGPFIISGGLSGALLINCPIMYRTLWRLIPRCIFHACSWHCGALDSNWVQVTYIPGVESASS